MEKGSLFSFRKGLHCAWVRSRLSVGRIDFVPLQADNGTYGCSADRRRERVLGLNYYVQPYALPPGPEIQTWTPSFVCDL